MRKAICTLSETTESMLDEIYCALTFEFNFIAI